MVFHIVILCLMVLSTAECMVGGRDAYPGQFPHQVLLQFSSTPEICGGSLIHPQWVLTAAHCVLDGITTVTVGKHNVNTTDYFEQTATVIKFIKHEGYTRDPGPSDIALMKLSEPFRLNNHVKIIALPAPNSEPTGKAVLSGWGFVDREVDRVMPKVLQTANVTLLNADDCIKKWHQLLPGNDVEYFMSLMDKNNICIDSGASRTSACHGDSGSPLLLNGKKEVIGVLAIGLADPQCTGDYPSIFTKVSPFVGWINAQIAAN